MTKKLLVMQESSAYTVVLNIVLEIYDVLK
jgi:hypothetical protein